MKRATSILTLAVLTALTFSTSASAQDDGDDGNLGPPVITIPDVPPVMTLVPDPTATTTPPTTVPVTTPPPTNNSPQVGYWYCPTAIYPRHLDGTAPEDGCTETEPVIVSEDGSSATGAWTGRPRPLPRNGVRVGSLPATGSSSNILIVAAGLLCSVGCGALIVARRRP